MMHEQLFSIDYLGKDKNVVRITILQGVTAQEVLPELGSFFATKLEEGLSRWVLDFQNVPFPDTAMIAFVISATQQTREKGGDLKLINAQDSARNNIVSFSPLAYLSVEENLFEVLQDFDVEPIASKPSNKKILTSVDIVDPPMVDSLSESEKEVDKIEVVTESGEEEKNTEHPSIEIQAENDDAAGEIESLGEDDSEDGLFRFHLQTESIASNLYKICDFVVEHSRRAGMEEKQIVKSKIAVYEACLNVIEHAYHSRPDNWIDVFVEYNTEMFKIIIQDHGISFEKSAPGEYDVEAAVEKRQTGGFGLHIIERSMDVVDYRANTENGNQLILLKYMNT